MGRLGELQRQFLHVHLQFVTIVTKLAIPPVLADCPGNLPADIVTGETTEPNSVTVFAQFADIKVTLTKTAHVLGRPPIKTRPIRRCIIEKGLTLYQTPEQRLPTTYTEYAWKITYRLGKDAFRKTRKCGT